MVSSVSCTSWTTSLSQNDYLTSFSTLLWVFMSLRAPVVASKTIVPSREIEFMGIILDSICMEARLPQDKLSRTYDLLNSFKKRRSVRLVELQSLIGTLQFACKVFITSGLTKSSLGTSTCGKFSSVNGTGVPSFLSPALSVPLT